MSRGRARTTCVTASTPPADAPMTMMRRGGIGEPVCGISAPAASGRRRICETTSAERQAHGENGARLRRACGGKIAAHFSREGAADREAEPRAPLLIYACRAELNIGLEDDIELFGGNADAVILNCDVDARLVRAIRHRDVSTSRRELDRVREEVEDDLTKPLLIGAGHDLRARIVDGDLDPLDCRLRADERCERAHGIAHENVPDVETQPSCFEFAIPDEVVEEAEDVGLRLQNALNVDSL